MVRIRLQPVLFYRRLTVQKKSALYVRYPKNRTQINLKINPQNFPWSSRVSNAPRAIKIWKSPRIHTNRYLSILFIVSLDAARMKMGQDPNEYTIRCAKPVRPDISQIAIPWDGDSFITASQGDSKIESTRAGSYRKSRYHKYRYLCDVSLQIYLLLI